MHWAICWLLCVLGNISETREMMMVLCKLERNLYYHPPTSLHKALMEPTIVQLKHTTEVSVFLQLTNASRGTGGSRVMAVVHLLPNTEATNITHRVREQNRKNCFMKLHVKCLHGENLGTKQITGLADWKDPSVIKSMACSYRGPKFGSQYPYWMIRNCL